MNKVAHYLQEHLLGEITSSQDIRRHFAHDGSILELVPAVIVYPKNEEDIRKTVRFAWQLAERGKILPITPRGGGTATTGSAIGSGIILAFTAHMNQLHELSTKRQYVVVQPGITYETLEKVLKSHGLFLPAHPTLGSYATIGGAIACNAIGQKSLKYGATAGFVNALRVVLSNGEIIETGPLGKKELNHKLGLQTLEGHIYRSLDKLLEENSDIIEGHRQSIKARYNTSGYNLFDIKKQNAFDLTPLFIGSEGTLGIITEALLDVAPYNSKTTSALISLDKLDDLRKVLPPILELRPSTLDMINRTALNQIQFLSPNYLEGARLHMPAAMHLFVEFDGTKNSDQKKAIKQLRKITERFGVWCQFADDNIGQQRLRKLLDSVFVILTMPQGQARALPVSEDVCVPVDRLVEFLREVDNIYQKVGLLPVVWGHAGNGVVRTAPVLDLSQTGDRQKLFKIQNGLYSAALRLGGSLSAGNGDGRIRSPYISLQYGQELYSLMLDVKKIFDPHGILNPDVKTATPGQIRALMRSNYSVSRFADHPPRG